MITTLLFSDPPIDFSLTETLNTIFLIKHNIAQFIIYTVYHKACRVFFLRKLKRNVVFYG